jgi:hypothetical protein
MNNRQSPHRVANETLLDERYLLFKRKLLAELDMNPEAYIDASLEFKVIRGQVINADAKQKSNGIGITNRFKVKGHVPVEV